MIVAATSSFTALVTAATEEVGRWDWNLKRGKEIV